MASGESVAVGAPFFLRAGEGEMAGEVSGVAVGVSAGEVVSDGLALGVSVGSGELAAFFLRDFGVSPGLGVAFRSAFEADAGDFFDRGRVDGVGVTDTLFGVSFGDGEGEGDSFLAVVFFFFRAGVGVGVVKIFFMVLPIDCSARTGLTRPAIRSAATSVRKNVTQSLT